MSTPLSILNVRGVCSHFTGSVLSGDVNSTSTSCPAKSNLPPTTDNDKNANLSHLALGVGIGQRAGKYIAEFCESIVSTSNGGFKEKSLYKIQSLLREKGEAQERVVGRNLVKVHNEPKQYCYETHRFV